MYQSMSSLDLNSERRVGRPHAILTDTDDDASSFITSTTLDQGIDDYMPFGYE
jgi:hypothetical protein